MKKGSFKHYYKLVTLLITLSTVPVIIVGLFSYTKSSQVIQSNSAKEKVQSVYQIQTNVERLLMNVDHSVTYFLNSPKTREIIREGLGAQNFKKYQNIRQELNHLQTIDTGIEDIILVNLEDKWLINNIGLSKLNQQELTDITEQYMNLPQSSSWVIEKYDEIVFNNDARNNCSHYINLVKKLPFTQADKTAVAGVLIPSCTLTEIMQQSTKTDTFMILNENNQIIAHNDAELIGEHFATDEKQILASIDPQSESGQFDSLLNGTNFKVTYRTSKYNNWTYLSFVKIADLNKQSSSIGWLTFLVCGLLFILSLIVSVIGSSKIYKPIRRLQNTVFETFTAFKNPLPVQHQNEFELIEHHIEHIVDKNVELEGRLQSQVSQLKQFFIMRLLQGKVHKDEINAKLVSFNAPTEWRHLTVFALQIDSFEGTKYQSGDRDLLLFAINNMVEDILSAEERFTPVVINYTQITILLDHFENQDDYLHFINEKAQQIQSEIKKAFALPVSIGISMPFTKLVNARPALKEGQEALKYRIKSGAESIIFFENLEQHYRFTAKIPTIPKNELFDAIKIADEQKVEAELAKFFQSIGKREFHHNQIQIIITRFLYDIVELIQILGIDLKELDERPILNELDQLSTLEEVQTWFKNTIINPLLQKVEERSESQDKSLSDKIIQIIHQEFDTDISLDSIATRLHYNPNYLSSIFQKEMNISFSEYLLNYRINTAKQLLIETDISVKDIAAKLQYNNSQNFIRSFRKIEGITPGKYRSQYKKAI